MGAFKFRHVFMVLLALGVLLQALPAFARFWEKDRQDRSFDSEDSSDPGSSRGTPHIIFYVQKGNEVKAADGRIMDMAVSLQVSRIRGLFKELRLKGRWDLPKENLHFFTGDDYLSGAMASAIEKIADERDPSPIDLITLSHSHGIDLDVSETEPVHILDFFSVFSDRIRPRLRFFMNAGCSGAKSIQPALLSGFKVAAGSPAVSLGNLIIDFFLREFTEGASYKEALSHVNWACREKISWWAVIRAVPKLVPGDYSSRNAYCRAADVVLMSRVSGAAGWEMMSQIPLSGVDLSVNDTSELSRSEDLGYRWDGERCLSSAGEEGLNPGFIGECGDFRNKEVSWIDFSEKSLRGADFSNSILSFNNFREADLEGALFNGVVSIKSDFSLANMGGSQFHQGRFYYSSLAGRETSGLDMTRATFFFSDLAPVLSQVVLASVSGRTEIIGPLSSNFTPGRRLVTNLRNADVRGVDLNEMFDMSRFCEGDDEARKWVIEGAIFDQHTDLPVCRKLLFRKKISKKEAEQYGMVHVVSKTLTKAPPLTEMYPGIALDLPPPLPAVKFKD